jgi:hypothetical protein
MTIPSSVRDGADVPVGAPPVLKQPSGHVTGPRFAGGEVAQHEYRHRDMSKAPDLYREKAPAPAKPYRDLND